MVDLGVLTPCLDKAIHTVPGSLWSSVKPISGPVKQLVLMMGDPIYRLVTVYIIYYIIGCSK